MKLYKIKDNYLFTTSKGNGNGFHTYAVYYDNVAKCYHAIQTTHLYVRDGKRFNQVKKGLLAVTKFKEFDAPSGVKNKYFNKNIKGGKIDIKDRNNVIPISSRYLSKKQSNFLKSFANKPEK